MKRKLIFLGGIILALLATAAIVAYVVIEFPIQRSDPNQLQVIEDLQGEYLWGDGLSVCTLEIRGARYQLEFHNDLAIHQFSEGQLTLVDSQLILDRPIRNRHDTCYIHRFILVKWGERRYLLPDDGDDISEMFQDGFCESVQKGWEPRDRIFGITYMRTTDIDVPVEGQPADINGKSVCP